MANSYSYYLNYSGLSDSSFSDDEEEFARRMSTKTAPTNEDTSKPIAKSEHINSKWKVGMHCRVDDGYGTQYEAVLLRILYKKKCIVRYIGYDNTELVLLSDLMPSLGNAERTQQIQDSAAHKVDESNDMGCGDQPRSPGTTSQKKKKPSNKRNKHTQTNSFNFPDIPMPNLAEFKNLSVQEMPPPPMLNTPQETEDKALFSMLWSWYMSGYYTGLYKGMKRAQEESKNKNEQNF